MLKKLIVFLVLLQPVFLNTAVASRDNFNKGWDAFIKNDRKEARKLFTQALNDPETTADAYLSLSLIDWNENKLDEAFVDFQKSYKSSENPYPVLYAMSSLPYVYEQILSKNRIEFFESALNDPKMNGTLKAMICDRLGRHYDKVNNMKKATDYFSKMGAINQWQVLGSFDNTSGSGFSKDWGAVSKARETDVFKNKTEANVSWYSPKYNRRDNWFAFDFYFYLNKAIFYAQSFVNSPVEQEVFLRAGTSGSLKIWVNDALISTVVEERNCDLDIYNYKVKLNQGNNRILVQIGQSEISEANFLIRLTDETGNPVKNLSNSSVYADYSKSTETTEHVMLPFFAEKFYEEKIAADKTNPLNYILLAEVYLHNDKAYEATKVLKDLEAATSKSTLSSYLLHEAYMRAQNQTDRDKELESIKEKDQNSFYALQARYNDAVKSEKYTEAEEICKQTKELYGQSSVTDEWDINLASYQKKREELLSMAKSLYKKYPSSAQYMNLNYLIAKNVNNDPGQAKAILEEYNRNYENSEVLDMLSNLYMELGNTAKGLALYYKRIQENPYASGYYDKLIKTLYRLKKYPEALAASDDELKLTPYLPDIYNMRGYIYKNMDQTDKAKESFQKSIYYGPTTYDSRTQLRLLNNKKEVYNLFPKTDLKELIAKSPTEKDYPEDNSIILLNEYQQVVYPEGAKEYRYELAIKILNKSGIEAWKEYGIGHNGYSQKLLLDKAEVIKAGGNTVKAETNEDENNVVFTNLEVNDVLHLEYRIQDLSTGKLANHFFDHFLFQYTIPSLISRYSLLVPNDKKFNYLVTNGKVEPEVSDVEDMKLYKWELVNQSAVKDEPYRSSLTDIAPTLYYSSMPDWKFVSDWYKDLTTSKFKSDYVLKETYNKLLKGKENASQLEKAKIFYNYILENITYSSVDFLQSNFIPQKASRTITTRLGDCKDLSTLFVALCREAGINANLVLILTRDNGSHTLVMPAINFNHCIAQLNIGSKVYYLELTDNNLPFGSALRTDLNSEILPVPFSDEKIGDKLISFTMPERQSNSSYRVHKVAFNKNDMSIDRSIVKFGELASDERSEFKNVGSEERLKKMNESVAKDFKASAKVSELKYTELDNLTDSVTISYHIDVKNAIQDVAGMKIFSLPWSDINSLDIVAADTRKYPMEYWEYQVEDKTTERIIIDLPQGKKLADNPQDIKYSCGNASYSLTFDTKTAGKVVITRTYERKADQVSTADYVQFRDFMNNITDADNKQYAFK